METTDGQRREMKYCDCKKPKKNGGDNYCQICDGLIANLLELPVKPAKNVKDFDWLDNKLNDILAQFEHKHITKEGAKDLLFEFIFEDLVNEIQELRDSSLSV